ncbi:MAG: hypothetical protein NVS1B13_24850 [Flavisolibacter sp.]
MEIKIEIKSLSKMRYPTVGDYYYDQDGVLRFEIADTGNDFYNRAILIHEMIEQLITEANGITEEEITIFDKFYEMRRAQGLVSEFSEPGFDESAPYRAAHSYATSCEMGLFAMTNKSWIDYDHTINSL